MWLSTAINNINRILLQFDISALPEDITITSAELEIYQNVMYYEMAGTSVWAYKLTRTDWIEAATQMVSTSGATWWSYKIVDEVHFPWTTAGGDYVTSAPSGGNSTVPDAENTWFDPFDVTDIVKDAYDNDTPVAMLLRYEDEEEAESYDWVYISSKEHEDDETWPKLTINYEEAGVDEIIIKYTSPNYIYQNCPANENYSFGLKLIAPTSHSDGVQKSITVRITAVATPP